jgi:hypothetical protein
MSPLYIWNDDDVAVSAANDDKNNVNDYDFNDKNNLSACDNNYTRVYV